MDQPTCQTCPRPVLTWRMCEVCALAEVSDLTDTGRPHRALALLDSIHYAIVRRDAARAEASS